MNKLVFSLSLLTLLTACRAPQAPVNQLRAVNLNRNTAVGSLAAANTGHAPAFSRKLANPKNYTFSTAIQSQSVCGYTDDLQHVEDYDGKGGPSKAFVDRHAPAVGALAMGPAGPDSRKFCSGTLISENLFLTASHCVDKNILDRFAVFNYQKAAGSEQLRKQVHVKIKSVVEDGGYQSGNPLAGGLDYAILELAEPVGRQFGFARVANDPMKNRRRISSIQHPRGKAKMVHGGKIGGRYRGMYYVTYVDMDTHPGSSGSGVLNTKGELVAVHTNGGCTAKGGENAGVPIKRIVLKSQVIKRMLAAPTR